MQIVIAFTFGICALTSYRMGKREGSIQGGLDAIEILRIANVINVNEKGEITPCIPQKTRSHINKKK